MSDEYLTELTDQGLRDTKLNLTMVETMRDFLGDRLTPADMAAFDEIWKRAFDTSTLPLAGDRAISRRNGYGTDRRTDPAASAIRRMNDLRIAEREVNPVVGDVTGLGMDSAAAVYKHALTKMGHAADLRSVHPDGYKDVFRAYQGAFDRGSQPLKVSKGYAERFGIGRIKHG